MGRPEAARWQFFTKLAPPSGMKTKRAKCNFCGASVSATSRNMDCHYRNCKSVIRSLGALVATEKNSRHSSSPSNVKDKDSGAPTHESNSKNLGPLSTFISNKLSATKKAELNFLFSREVHGTATPFSFFDNHIWYDFFKELNP